MMRKKFEPGLKAKVALEAFRGEKTTAQLSSEYGVHPSQISQWKQELIDRSKEIFSKPDHNGARIEERQSLIDKEPNVFSLRQQCVLLGIVRSTLYYQPVGINARDQMLMNLLDQQYTKTPFWGVRNMTTHLKRLGHKIGKDHVRTLLRRLGLEAIVPRRNLSKRNPQHAVYPYLLRDVEIIRPNQVWSTDITYIRLEEGFVYLAAIIDWFSRYVLSWRLSNTLDNGFCIEALQEALSRYSRPDIFNSDQGVQFTSADFIAELIKHQINISMDGRGRYLDNIFVERLWRSVKYENVYLCGYQTIPEARRGLTTYFEFYNKERYHQSLNNETPSAIYNGSFKMAHEAAII